METSREINDLWEEIVELLTDERDIQSSLAILDRDNDATVSRVILIASYSRLIENIRKRHPHIIYEVSF